ncbi:hypothetical protein DT076_12375 [Desertihabitans brevis]|uniref:Glycosyltransferase n=1 Tax=Desertihabitans brevis TaxID=2268447 RepID=A0A367YTF9_9ACTN|nr:glycosyltransferase [Desertihabitans brevis]RCK69134.1 hypothetical protein DT076_12375 [Desertihabitans brevis]
MYAHLTGFKPDAASPVAEIHQALRAVPAGRDGADLLGYTPVARVNPYQSMLYRSFSEQGVAVAPILRGHDFRVVGGFRALARSRTVHFHWLSWVLANVADRDTASRMLNGLLARVDRFRDDGGKVVWTVHNVYPHDAVHLEEELSLQQGIADRSDAVHVMSEATVEAMRGVLSMDSSRVVVSPHPSYVGAYPDLVSRAEARGMLGIADDEVVFVVFGALKRYKGLLETMAAFRRLSEKGDGTRYRLVVAGMPDDDATVAGFVRECGLHPRVLIEPRRIAGERAQIYLKAADLGLVTYTRSLNSGAALLFLSFGLPVLASATPTFGSLPPEHVSLLPVDELGDPDAYASALAAAGQAAAVTRPRQSVLQSISHLHSETVSEQLCRDLAPRLGWRLS